MPVDRHEREALYRYRRSCVALAATNTVLLVIVALARSAWRWRRLDAAAWGGLTALEIVVVMAGVVVLRNLRIRDEVTRLVTTKTSGRYESTVRARITKGFGRLEIQAVVLVFIVVGAFLEH